jgi:hypothetical protein
LYILTALVQFFTALRDFQGHSVASLTSSILLGPLAPLLGVMKAIIIGLPSFVFKTVLMTGISILGKVAVVGVISAAIIGALGLLIVTAAEKMK